MGFNGSFLQVRDKEDSIWLALLGADKNSVNLKQEPEGRL